MKKMSLTMKIFIGLIFGVIVGLLMQGVPDVAQIYIKPFGTLFLNLIKMIIVPLVFSSLIIGVAGIGDPKLLGRIGWKTIVYYLVTTAIAVFIGLFLGIVMNPGAGFAIPIDVAIKEREVPSIITTLLNIIPKNPLQGLVNGNILQVIAFALFLGVGCTFLPKEKSKPFLRFCDSVAEIMYKITGFIMKLAPYGIFALIVPTFASYGIDVLKPLSIVILAVYIGVILHAVCVYSVAVKIFGKISPLKFFRAMGGSSNDCF